MVITKITYGESYEAVNSYGLKSWNKLGVEIEMEAGESVDEAYQTAHQFIKEKLSKQMEEEPVIQKKKDNVSDDTKAYIEAINSAETVEELKEKYWLRSKSNLTLSAVYLEKKKQLEDAGTKK